jgi:LmbE family N-acetylglucosaminyl deacetylase
VKLQNPTADILVPDGKPVAEALARITHLGIGAHSDDLEFMALHGIFACYDSATQWFGGVTCTNGAGSARAGRYAKFTDAQLMATRRQEQRTAATLGRYGVMIQLDYPSAAAQNPGNRALPEDLRQILAATKPQVVYTHNPADKHPTHVGVVVATLQAIHALPAAQRPQRVWGCEVWRALDWLPDDDKVLMDVSGHDELAAALTAVFDSQIAGGKRYDLATLGRQRANATFFASHAGDKTDRVIFGIDLTPLANDDSRDIVEYVGGLIEKFQTDVTRKLRDRLKSA